MFALQYHEATKHHFDRFARSAGRLDWATQPNPFRRFAGAHVVPLGRDAVVGHVQYEALFDGRAETVPVTDASVGEFLRCSMGLSAWKQYQATRWALRVNPSSGNLHPTEAYLVRDGRICHYAPREHALEERCRVSDPAWRLFAGTRPGFVVGLTSIYWREAWKYGERAFRYCQHDTGHAIGAMRLAAAMLGWTFRLLPAWSDAQIAGLLGLDRADDYEGAEPEDAECLAVVTPGDPGSWLAADRGRADDGHDAAARNGLVHAAREAVWHGRANALSPSQVTWPIIDDVAAATRRPTPGSGSPAEPVLEPDAQAVGRGRATEVVSAARMAAGREGTDARALILQRRSAVAFDARSVLPRPAFLSMMQRLDPVGPPWDTLDWPPHVHLVLFLHRVEGLTPGVYACLRDERVLDEWRTAMRPEFLWEPVDGDRARPWASSCRLFLLLPTDVIWPATRVSCDQDIAGHGFFSLGMIARVRSSIQTRGGWFYRRLFWECGLIGQVLYLEAEAHGARGTGIGCFYDDAVHELLGLSGTEWQSLYHFSMGVPVDDARLTTEPGYEWESEP